MDKVLDTPVALAPETTAAEVSAEVASAQAAPARARRTRRERPGDHAIERIAAAARTLAESEAKAAAPVERPRIGPMPAPATQPAKVKLSSAPAMLAQRVRMSGNLPYYAAALCFTLGFGGLLGSHLQASETINVADAETAKIERALPWKRDVAEATPRENVKLRDDVRALRSEIAALRTNGEQLRQSERDKQAGEIRNLRAALENQKAETASLKADFAAKVERADREVVQRADKTAERVDRLERRLADTTATGSIPAKSVVEALPKPPEKAAIPGIALRDAGRGVALLETRRGLLEVVPGDNVPGAGKVETIERSGGKWRVVTSIGFIEGRID